MHGAGRGAGGRSTPAVQREVRRVVEGGLAEGKELPSPATPPPRLPGAMKHPTLLKSRHLLVEVSPVQNQMMKMMMRMRRRIKSDVTEWACLSSAAVVV